MKKPEWSDLPQKLWDKIDKTDTCWLWTGHISDGYGKVGYNNKVWGVHRLVLDDYRGLPLKMYALHTCDVRSCANPLHLYAVTQKQNVQDMFRRGRGNRPKGERNNHNKLTTEQVLQIRELHAQGAVGRKLALEFGVTPSNIGYIVRGKTWKHLL